MLTKQSFEWTLIVHYTNIVSLYCIVQRSPIVLHKNCVELIMLLLAYLLNAHDFLIGSTSGNGIHFAPSNNLFDV